MPFTTKMAVTYRQATPLTRVKDIGRFNKEFRRRTKAMEIVTGKIACYRILAYVSLTMELHWRTNPSGKVRKNLPFFKEFVCGFFLQKIFTKKLDISIVQRHNLDYN